MKPQLKNVIVKLALESMLVGVLPFSVHNLERDVLKYNGAIHSIGCRCTFHMSYGHIDRLMRIITEVIPHTGVRTKI